MDKKELLDYIEDKDIEINDKWFYHGTRMRCEVIEDILNEGIKCAYLRNEKSSGGFNGRYYVCLSRKTDDEGETSYNLFRYLPILVIDNIKALRADSSNAGFVTLKETILPFRTSTYPDEYQKFMYVEPSKIIALGYSLYHMLEPNRTFDKYKLNFLKDMILLLDKLNKDIPVYDLTSSKEINKEKVRQLEINNIEID